MSGEAGERSGPAKGGPTSDRDATADKESWLERGVALRVGFYVFGTHLFAGFIWLLFYLGQHADK
ncbi:DUF6126 family protein [Streptomyces sp. NPDC057702]|uniref:DUF6126 family protein n=1 Tax=unclassified Streptomyces TaxID=2593676 RepID=UPI00367A5DA1